MNIYTKWWFSLPCLLAIILVASSPASVFGAKKDDEKAGAVLFRDKGCAYCHGVGGIGAKKGPSLVGIPKDKAWPTDKITSQILNGGPKMPPFRESLTDEEVAQLVAYLRTKNKPIAPASEAQDSAPAPAPGGGQ